MHHAHHHHSNNICAEIEAVIRSHPEGELSIRQLMRALHEKGFGLIMMIIVLPNCVPIPIPPGGSTIFSIPLLFLSVQMVIGRSVPWLPKWLRDKTVSQSFLLRVLNVVSPRLNKIERLLKPRMSFTASKLGERITGFFWLMFSISIAVPLPMTNFLPGIGILISSLGLISRDGYVVLIGFAVGTVGLLVTTAILLLGSTAILQLFG